MRPLRPLLGGLACLIVCAARAEAPPDPLRLVPDQADFFVELRQPRQLIEAGTSTDLFKTLYALPPVREYYDSTTARRAFQLLAYFEEELGAKWPELLVKVGGGGIVVAGKFGDNPQPALLVIQGTDADLASKFYRTALDVIAQELARQEIPKEAIKKGSYKDVETVHIGDFYAARAGAAILVSNNEDALHGALDRHLDGGKQSLAALGAVKDSAKLLPPHALARLWLNLDVAKKSPQGKDIFTSPRNDVNLTVLFGGNIDVASRSPYLTAGVYREKDGFMATLRMPAGRDGASADFALHVPPADGPGLLPLLEPKDVVYSSSFYLDVSKIWDDRNKLFNPMQAKQIEEAGKNAGVRLIGLAPDKVLKQAGARHRVVVVDQPAPAYKGAPQTQPIPAFAVVTEMRDPDEFSKSMESALRAAALFAGNQYKVKLNEEKHGGYNIVGWRFPVDVKVDSDAGNIRFNFSPCFVRVHNQFVFCSTLELCHQLVDLLDRESKARALPSVRGATASRFYGSGGAALLRGAQDIITTQAVLDQAVTPEAAREQAKALIELVQRLGNVDTEVVYEAKQFRYDLRWKMGK